MNSITNFSFTDLVDLEQVRRMLMAHFRVTGMAAYLLDTEENVLLAVGEQEICTRFHRRNPETLQRCRESDAYVKEHLGRIDGDYLDYRCRNGLRDVALPIVIAGRHVATFFTGQFFYADELPDEAAFLEQAREFGFEREDYLAAVRRTPILGREQLRNAMEFFRDLVHLVAEMGLKNLTLAEEVRERQAAEEALRQKEAALRYSEGMLRSVFETLPDQLNVIDRELRVVHSNWKVWRESEARGETLRHCHDLYCGGAMPCESCHVRDVFATGKPAVLEKFNPQVGHVEIHAYPVFDAAGSVTTVLEHVHDINDRKRADEMLRESEQRLRMTIQGSSLPIFTVGTDGKIGYWNRALERLTGVKAEEVVGTDGGWRAFHHHQRPLLADLLAQGKSDELAQLYEGVLRPSQLIDEAYEGRCFSSKLPGGGKWVHFTAAALRDTKGNLIGAMETMEDVTEQMVAQEKWHSLYHNLPGGSYTVNDSCIIEDVNDVVCSLTGFSREELVGQPCSLICDNCRDDGCDFRHHGRSANKEMILRAKSGRAIPIIKSARRISAGNRDIIIENFHDLSAQKELEQLLRHSQKIDAIGQLAGGVAHDLNNILTVIMGNATLLQMHSRDGMAAKPLESIVGAAEKAAHVTASLLAFSRKNEMRLLPGSVNAILRKAESLLCRLVPADIELRFAYGADHAIRADSVQIEQVVMNLVTNARDAMPDGGKITVRSEEVIAGAPSGGEAAQPRQYVAISVTDTGAGMSEEVQRRVFEPYFTTKPAGKGTGLGLAIVQGIVKEHGGFIGLHSEPGKGTTVRVFLPPLAEGAKEQTQPAKGAPRRGSELVLLAEDDPAVRSVTRRVLEEYGYRVLEAVDGQEAVEKFEESRDEINLALLDVIMPRRNGKAAYDEMRRMRPALKALFMSGYAGDFLSDKVAIGSNANFILKPAPHAALLHRIRQVLDDEEETIAA